MTSRLVLTAAFSLALPVQALEPGFAQGKMAITFEKNTAIAEGITPGATVAWLGVSRTREEWSDHFFHWRLTTEDVDKKGSVTYPNEGGFPQQTVLVAIDLTSGAFAVGATYPLATQIPGPDFGAGKADPAGALTSFTHRGPSVDILVARAGAGAWSARVLDGGPLDADGVRDGIVTLGLSALPSRGGKAARLDGIRPGDVVAMVDAEGPSVRIARATGAWGKE